MGTRQCVATSEFVGMFLSKGWGPFCSWSLMGIVPHGSEILWQGTSYVTVWLCHWPLVTTTSLSVFIADSPQVSHFPPLCLCFCIPHLSILSNCAVGLRGKWLFPPWRWLCDRDPVLVGNSKPYVIHAIKEMQTSECGTGPWEAFPMLLIMMTEICFLHRQATSMHVDKIQTGNNNCNKIITIIKVRVPTGKKIKVTALHFLWGNSAAPWPRTCITIHQQVRPDV